MWGRCVACGRTWEQQAQDRLIDGMRAIEHDLRWDNQGVVAAQIKALADQFEKDTQS